MYRSKKNKQSDQLTDYRKLLVSAEQKSQEDFDKTVLSLSGGALGVSFVFVKDIIGTQPIVLSNVLLASWLAWAFSTFAVLTSYYLSHLALRCAISQVDNGTIYNQHTGGAFSRLTAILNAIGAILFLVGVCCITVFAGANLPTKGVANDRKETTISTAPPNSATATTNVTSAHPNTGQAANNGRIYSPAAASAAPKI